MCLIFLSKVANYTKTYGLHWLNFFKRFIICLNRKYKQRQPEFQMYVF